MRELTLESSFFMICFDRLPCLRFYHDLFGIFIALNTTVVPFVLFLSEVVKTIILE